MRIGNVFLTVLAASSVLLAACGGTDITPAPTTLATPASVSSNEPTLEPTVAPTAAPTTVSTVVPPVSPTPAATPVPSPTLVATEAEFFLQLIDPQGEEVITEERTIDVVGRTRVDAVVTVNDSLIEPDSDGLFMSNVDLEEGPNIIEVIASVASGEQEELILVVIYVP